MDWDVLINGVASKVGQRLNSVTANKIGATIAGMHPRSLAIANAEMKNAVRNGSLDGIAGVMAGDGWLGAGGRGVARMAGGIAHYRGTNKALRKVIADKERELATAGTDEAKRAIQADIDALKGQLNSVGRMGTAAMDVAQGFGQYLWSGSWGQRAAKIGAAAGLYVTGAGALRALTTGGGMFKDSQGNFDIAGIPFV
jgi:hypothetical protein